MSDTESDIDESIFSQLEKKVDETRENIVDEQKKKNPKHTWSLADFKEKKAALLIGKSESGKSYLLRYLITYLSCVRKLWKVGIVFSGTAKFNNDYSFLPPQCVIQGFSEDKLKKWLEKLTAAAGPSKNYPPSFMILDDCLGLIGKSEYLKNFLSIFRHYNISLFICTQYLKSDVSGTILRAQLTYLIAFRTASKPTIHAMYENWGQECGDETDFRKLFLKQTQEEHTAFLWIDGQPTDKNFLSIKAPGEYPQLNISF
jgi:hypothetical protein